MFGKIARFTPPERLIPQGWVPEGWFSEDPKVNIPPGVKYFTPEDALEVARLCPAAFPPDPSDWTAYFRLTVIASSGRMAAVRLMTDTGKNPIVAVGFASVRSSKLEGPAVDIEVIVESRFQEYWWIWRKQFNDFLEPLMYNEKHPIAYR